MSLPQLEGFFQVQVCWLPEVGDVVAFHYAEVGEGEITFQSRWKWTRILRWLS